jgi:hypothetical protein
MTPEQKEKAAQLHNLYAAMASGETVQVFKTDTAKWWDLTDHDGGPNLNSELKWWRIKPKPLRVWLLTNEVGDIVDTTLHSERAAQWRIARNKVIETVQVMP